MISVRHLLTYNKLVSDHYRARHASFAPPDDVLASRLTLQEAKTVKKMREIAEAASNAQEMNRVFADVQLFCSGVIPLVPVFGVACLARRRMWENIICSVTYDLIGVALQGMAACIWLRPCWALDPQRVRSRDEYTQVVATDV